MSNLIKSESFDDGEIPQFIIESVNDSEEPLIVPSTSNESTLVIQEVKHKPEEVFSEYELSEIHDTQEFDEVFHIIEFEPTPKKFKPDENKPRTIKFDKYTCDVCLASFKQRVYFDRHVQLHDNKFVINVNMTEDEINQALTPNILVERKSFPCEYCSKRFKSKKERYEHYRTEHRDEKKDIECKFCDYKTDSKVYYEEHMKRHGTDSNADVLVKCPQCPEFFKNYRMLKFHEDRVHINLICEVCKKSYKTKKILLKHRRLCHGLFVDTFVP